LVQFTLITLKIFHKQFSGLTKPKQYAKKSRSCGWRTTHTYKALAYLSFGDVLTEEGKYTEALGKLDTASIKFRN